MTDGDPTARGAPRDALDGDARRPGGGEALDAGDRLAAALRTLRRDLGEGAVREHEPIVVDGCPLPATLAPTDADQLAATLVRLGELQLGAIVRGGGSRLGVGNAPRGPALLLSTEALAGILEFDDSDGVVHVRSGTLVAALREEANAAGWELPLDPPGARATVGGTLASAAVGPRSLGFGAPRDCVLGMKVSLASGDRTSCGGRVVKNVTGYDLAKLYTGSFGSLGVIESVWLRLRPLPEQTSTLLASVPEMATALALALEAARRDSARAVSILTPGLSSRLGAALISVRPALVAEFAGHRSTVERDASWLSSALDRLGVQALPVPAIDGADVVRTLQLEGDVRARIAVKPSELGRAIDALGERDVDFAVHPGLGWIQAAAAVADTPAALRALTAVDAAAAVGSGDLVLEELPLELKRTRDVFGDPGPLLSLTTSLKRQFDPGGILNPGRFRGRV